MEVILLCGFQGSGKSHFTNNFPNAIIISNDITKDKAKSLKILDENLSSDIKNQIIIDNTNLTQSMRKEFIDICKKYSKPIKCIYINSDLEDCQIRVLHRQYETYQRLFLDKSKIDVKDSRVFPVATLFSARKQLEKPVLEEGFTKIEILKVSKMDFSSYCNKAVFFDIDGTLRKTDHLPNKYPIKSDEVELYKPKEQMMKTIQKYRSEGYLFCGVSNQSGISKGILTEKECIQCMDKVKELLEFPEIEIKFCPHTSSPITCYCRKPQSGLGMYFIEKYKIDPEKSIMVGDMTTDKTFALRLGMRFYNVDDFFVYYKKLIKIN